MLNRLTISAICLGMIACDLPITKESDVLTEPATIETTVFSPSQHGSGTGFGPVMGGKGGMTITFVSVDVPEKYATVFRCQHGKFIIEGKGLWSSVKPGDTGTVYYRDVLHCDHDGANCHLVDYDFLRFEVSKQISESK